MAEVAVPRQIFHDIRRLIARLRASPVLHEGTLGLKGADYDRRGASW